MEFEALHHRCINDCSSMSSNLHVFVARFSSGMTVASVALLCRSCLLWKLIMFDRNLILHGCTMSVFCKCSSSRLRFCQVELELGPLYLYATGPIYQAALPPSSESMADADTSPLPILILCSHGVLKRGSRPGG